MKKKIIAGLATGLLLVGMQGWANANLITNGSFEGNGDIGDFMTLNAGDNSIDGWTVQSGSIDWIQDYWQASDGTRSLDLAGYFSQGTIVGINFNTIVGQTYLVQFDMAGNPDKTYDKAMIGAAVGDVAHNFSFSQAGNTRQNMGWETMSFTFTATDTTSQLKFGDVTGASDQAWGAALDNVRADVAPVPEPATMLLFGTGILGLAGSRCRRKKVA